MEKLEINFCKFMIIVILVLCFELLVKLELISLCYFVFYFCYDDLVDLFCFVFVCKLIILSLLLNDKVC